MTTINAALFDNAPLEAVVDSTVCEHVILRCIVRFWDVLLSTWKDGSKLDMIQERSDPEKRTWLICRGMNDVGTTGTDEAVEICGEL